jgi:hypothetical protein
VGILLLLRGYTTTTVAWVYYFCCVGTRLLLRGYTTSVAWVYYFRCLGIPLLLRGYTTSVAWVYDFCCVGIPLPLRGYYFRCVGTTYVAWVYYFCCLGILLLLRGYTTSVAWVYYFCCVGILLLLPGYTTSVAWVLLRVSICLQTFQNNLLPASSRLTLRMEAACSSAMLGNINKITHYNHSLAPFVKFKGQTREHARIVRLCAPSLVLFTLHFLSCLYLPRKNV